MLHSLSRADLGGLHVTVAKGVAFQVSLAHTPNDQDVAFGLGLEVALARAAVEGQAPTPPEWVQLLPAPVGPEGEIRGRDGRRWTLKDPTVLIPAFAAMQCDPPLDVEHASELLAPQGKEAPAQAWLKEIQIRADNTTWARVDWTAEGARKVVDRQYRYISPAILHTDAGEIVGIKSAALVTQPALAMPALAHREGRTSIPNRGSSMNLLQRLLATCSLPATATEDDVVAAVTTQVSLAADTRNPEKFVPAADLQVALARATTAETKLAEIEAAEKTKAAEATVDAAIAEGKIAPASREHWISVAHATPDAFGKAVAAMPALLKPSTTDKKPGEGGKVDEHGLTTDQLALCSSLGIAPADFAKTQKETAQ